LPLVEKHYNVTFDADQRAIVGLSMGGEGSFMYALHHPELFSSAAPMSADVGPLTVEDLKKELENKGITNYSEDDLQTYFEQHNAVELVKGMTAEKAASVRWYIDCGDDDFLYRGNAALHVLLRDLEIPHEYRVRDGAHNWTYWRTWIGEGLRFVGEGFRR